MYINFSENTLDKQLCAVFCLLVLVNDAEIQIKVTTTEVDVHYSCDCGQEQFMLKYLSRLKES